ncbi:hypothetical protein TNCV_4015221 [Trichonephila clavipes]|nr:hypothetical protein TNCV_4015221 [Trichonephila clavipes]
MLRNIAAPTLNLASSQDSADANPDAVAHVISSPETFQWFDKITYFHHGNELEERRYFNISRQLIPIPLGVREIPDFSHFPLATYPHVQPHGNRNGHDRGLVGRRCCFES